MNIQNKIISSTLLLLFFAVMHTTAQSTLNLFYLSGSVNDSSSEMKMSEKMVKEFFTLRKRFANDQVFAYFNNKNKPVVTKSFKDDDEYYKFFNALNDSTSRAVPENKLIDLSFRYNLYKIENSKKYEKINFYVFMNNAAMESAARQPDSFINNLPLELAQVIGIRDAEVTLYIYYETSKLSISEEDISSQLSFNKTNDNFSYQYKPL